MILTFSRREARVRVFYNVVTELQPELVRAIGRWTLTALMLNTIIGGGIAGLPSLLAAHLSRFSPAGYLLAALGVGLIVACLAEVASQFQRTGGPYLYARIAFGRFVAIQIGWLAWLTRIAAASAAADLFVSYLAQFFPMAEVSPARELVLALLIGFLAIVNYRGVSQGARVSNLFTSAKLLVLAFFISGGVLAILLRPGIRVDQPSSPIAAADWFDALLLMTYAYGGFEAALFVSGRDAQLTQRCSRRVVGRNDHGDHPLCVRAIRGRPNAPQRCVIDTSRGRCRGTLSGTGRRFPDCSRHPDCNLRLSQRKHAPHTPAHVRHG